MRKSVALGFGTEDGMTVLSDLPPDFKLRLLQSHILSQFPVKYLKVVPFNSCGAEWKLFLHPESSLPYEGVYCSWESELTCGRYLTLIYANGIIHPDFCTSISEICSDASRLLGLDLVPTVYDNGIALFREKPRIFLNEFPNVIAVHLS